MGTIWTRDNGGALTGTERIGADKANSGNPADSVHYTTEQLADFGESQNAAVPRPADANTLLILDAIADVANSAANTATIANAAADNAQAAADDAQTTADTAAAAAVAAQDAVDAITPASIGAATVAEAGNALTAAQNAQTTADNAASAATAAQGTADNAVSAAGVAQATADGAQTTANAALPKPGGTTTANGLAYGTGTTGAAVAISTTTIADLVSATATAQTTATDALYPLVQTAHTSATKTLAAGDAGDIIPLNAASNAIAVTIPHTLFEAGGTGRAWACGFYVTSVAGGAVTFTGSGGIVIKYFGKKPSATAIVAGDTIFVTVVSATLAHVWISAEIP